MIVSRFAIVTQDLVIWCYQVTKIYSMRYGFAIAFSARGPCDFCPLADLAISVFREVSINIVFTRIRTSRRRGLYRWSMRRTCVWISVFRNSVIHKIFSEFLQPFRDLRITRVSTFYRGFLFIWFWDFVGLDFLRFPWSIINKLRHWHWRDATIRCIFLFSNRNFIYCMWKKVRTKKMKKNDSPVS